MSSDHDTPILSSLFCLLKYKTWKTAVEPYPMTKGTISHRFYLYMTTERTQGWLRDETLLYIAGTKVIRAYPTKCERWEFVRGRSIAIQCAK